MTDAEVAKNLNRVGSLYRSTLDVEMLTKSGTRFEPNDMLQRQLAILELYLEGALKNVRAKQASNPS